MSSRMLPEQNVTLSRITAAIEVVREDLVRAVVHERDRASRSACAWNAGVRVADVAGHPAELPHRDRTDDRPLWSWLPRVVR